ncbi:MAG: response regulator, partial [Deltaproteobacteria bacterium]|nr:response regulator [Deltaproteobacteria bacterium]
YYSLDSRMKHKDGSWVWVLDRGKVIEWDENGSPLKMFGTHIDITERKHLETSLNELLAQRQVILDNVPVGIAYMVDRKVVWCNSNMAAGLGCTVDALIGQTTEFAYISTEEYEEELRRVYAKLAVEETFYGERLYKRKDNTVFWCSVTGKAVDPKDPLRGSIWIAKDISQQKHYEEELVTTREEALSANQAKGEFLANMSHEIRTPLNAITGFIMLLLETTLTFRQKKLAETASQACQALLRIVNDILDFSRIEAAKMELDPAGFELEKLLKETINMLHPAVNRKKLDLRLEISPSLPKVVIGDKGKLKQVLTNLVDNAIKFTSSGSINVKAGGYEDSTLLPQNENDLILLMSVEDTGIGIPPEQLKRIFEPFIQGDSSFSKRYQGAGLGLAITKRLVEIMGGRIWVESRPSIGSTFYFTVRFKIGSGSDIITDKAADQHGRLTLKPLRILLAEDNIINQKFGEEVLKSRGHTVRVANNGKEVLDLLNKEAFDLILMDVSMPEMDGIEATKEIRNSLSDKFDKNIPIIAQTAHAVDGDRERFLQIGMDGYISKPIDEDQLAGEMARVVRRFVNHRTDKADRDQVTGIDEGIHPVMAIPLWP